MKVEHGIGLATHDRAQQIPPVSEVVRDLRSADSRRLAHLVDIESCDAVLKQDVRSSPDDPLSGGESFRGEIARFGRMRTGHLAVQDTGRDLLAQMSFCVGDPSVCASRAISGHLCRPAPPICVDRNREMSGSTSVRADSRRKCPPSSKCTSALGRSAVKA